MLCPNRRQIDTSPTCHQHFQLSWWWQRIGSDKNEMILTKKRSQETLLYSNASSPGVEVAKKSTWGRKEKSTPKSNASLKSTSGRNSELKSKLPNGESGMVRGMAMRQMNIHMLLSNTTQLICAGRVGVNIGDYQECFGGGNEIIEREINVPRTQLIGEDWWIFSGILSICWFVDSICWTNNSYTCK